MSNVEAYPLQWPVGWERTEPHRRVRANFSKQVVRSFAVVRDELLRELRLLGARPGSVVISSNVPLRKDGLPYSGMRQPDDVGVAVYFELDGRQRCFPCDKWDRVEDNLRAISASINALRGLDRWGAKQMVDAAFSGFNALPEASESGWWTVLGVARDASSVDVDRAYRQMVRHYHPDRGGNVEMFHVIQDALEQFRRERGEA